MRDWAQVHGGGVVDLAAARAALELYDVDEPGLDRLDRAVLEALCRRFGGGPVGLSTLAVAVGEETETVETVAEPFLVREGFWSARRAAGPRRRGLGAPRADAAVAGAPEPHRPRCRSGRGVTGGSVAQAANITIA